MAHNPACERFWPELSPYIDGELEPSSRVQLERHLSACSDCSALVDDFRAEGGLIRLGLDMAADEADFTGFAQKVLARVTPERPPFFERLRISFDEFFTHHRGMVLTSLATAAAVLLVGLPIFLLQGAPQGYAGETMELQAVRVAEEAHVQPVVLEVEAEEATIIWLVDEEGQRRHDDEDFQHHVLPGASGLDAPRPKGGEL